MWHSTERGIWQRKIAKLSAMCYHNDVTFMWHKLYLTNSNRKRQLTLRYSFIIKR